MRLVLLRKNRLLTLKGEEVLELKTETGISGDILSKRNKRITLVLNPFEDERYN